MPVLENQMIDIKHYATKAHEAAKAKGWWNEPSSMPTLKALIISELCEALEADRTGRHANVAYFKHRLAEIESSINSPVQGEILTQHYKTLFKSHIKDSVSDELADAAIRILDVLGWNKKKLGSYKGTFVMSDEALAFFTFSENIYEIIKEVVQSSPRDNYFLLIPLRYIEALAESLNIDLIWHIEAKLRYNKLRGHKHGKKY